MQLSRGAQRILTTPLAAVVLAALLGFSSSEAQPTASYADFQAMSQPDLATLQVKLTYVGPQERGIASLVLTSTSGTLDLSLFVPCRRSDYPYFGDEGSPNTLTASTATLEALIDSVGTLPGVTDGDVDDGGFLSFALLNTVAGTQCFEAIVDETNGRDLLAKIGEALAPDSTAERRLTELGCYLDLLSPTPPAEVTGSVSVVLSGVRLQRSTGLFVARLAVTNTSGSSIDGPITIVLDAIPTVRLVSETGFTCRISPTGSPYVDVISVGSLAPAAVIERVILFENPDLDSIRIAPRAFAGPGAR